MPAFKQTVCKFWLAGACDKGRSCTWAHGDEDGHASISNGAAALVFKRDAPFHSMPLILPAQQAGVKRTLCKFFLQGTCDKGEACTWAHGDQELGLPIAEAMVEESIEDAFDSSLAELLQAAEEEEQAANEEQSQAATEERPIKRTLCKFFQEGICRNGDNCSWAHGQEELALPLMEVEPEVLTWPPVLVIPGHEAAGPNERRTICKFWKAGNCSRGDECTWAHGAPDLGATAFVEPEVQKPLTIVLPRHEPTGPNEKRTICKYWQAGHCALGDECTWAHGAHELGAAAFVEPEVRKPLTIVLPRHEPAGLNEKRTICKYWQAGHCALGHECTWAHGAPNYEVPEEAPLIAWAGPNAKRTICKYWQAGNCALGNDCTYAHGAKDLAASAFVQPEILKPLIVLPKHEPSGLNEKRTICKFWQAGQCARGYECTFAHGEQDLAVSSQVVPVEEQSHFFAGPNEKRTICKYWQAGHCANGDECTWAHGMRDLAVAPTLPVKPPVVSSTGKIILPSKLILPNASSTSSSPWRDLGTAGKGSVSSTSASSSAAAPKFRSIAATENTRTLCKFWIQGSCARGRDCTFSHGEEEIAFAIKSTVKLPARTDKGSSWAPPSDEVEQPVRRSICKFWQQGSCQQEPGQCTWAHGEWEIGTLVGFRSQPKGKGKTNEDVGPAFKRQRYY